MALDELGVVGNCQCAALVDSRGSIVWACLPRFDSEPVFSSLLDAAEGGHCSIGPPSGAVGRQRYLENTNVLETRFDSHEGGFRILDFCPRFMLLERSHRPPMTVRVIEPLRGAPQISVRCEPRLGWSKATPQQHARSDGVSYLGFARELRLTTDLPLDTLDGRPHALTQRRFVTIAWDPPAQEPLSATSLLRETVDYWQRWVKHCNVPPWYQDEVIRSALVLKLCCFEETGAIVAGLTTSIPESPGSGRTWDYRYCWLRDAYYVLGAFRLLGHFEERELFLKYLLNVTSSAPDLQLAPLYRIDGRVDLEERTLPEWPGFEGNGPVRVGNAAATHLQFDIYGEAVLALNRIFADARFGDQATPALFDLLVGLTRKAIDVAGKPDAGIWEYRANWRPHTFSTLLSWAAAARMAKVASSRHSGIANELGLAATRLREEILTHALHPTRGCLVSTYGGTEVDASLLQAVTLRLLPPNDPRMAATIEAIRLDLGTEHGWLRRYRSDDGFGVPSVAFAICTFWLVEALAVSGRLREARELLERARRVRAPLGLLAEDVDPVTGQMWGNFPQAYSHVGMIHAAFAASPSWAEEW